MTFCFSGIINTNKVNEILDKFLLLGDEFVPEMHVRQPGFTESACGPFTKNKKRIQKFKEKEEIQDIYENEFDKACFKHNMAYGDFKDLPRRTDKAFNIAETPTYDEYQRGLASMVYNFF